MTQLIVALDVDDPVRFDVVFHRCRIEAGVTFFKVNARALLWPPWAWHPVQHVRQYDCDVMLDLKLYDTADTVHAIARRAFDLGARFLTVHATPSMLDAAMRAKPAGDYHKVLAVGRLTDDPTPDDDHLPYIKALGQVDGIVCPVTAARWLRHPEWGHHGADCGKLLVCPGIRRPQVCVSVAPGVFKDEPTNNHVNPSTPSEARVAGADYIVVGRPIVDAEDPAAAARAIMEEIA